MTPHDRFLSLDDATRAFWLDPAERAFFEHGFAGASVNRLIAGLKTSKGRFYHYFDDKAALYRATLERALSRIPALDDGLLLDAPDAAGFWAGAATLAQRFAAALQSDPSLAALLRDLYREAEAQKAMTAPLARIRARFTAYAAAGQRLGALRPGLPPDLLAEAAFDMLLAIDRWFARNAATLSAAEETRLSGAAFALLASGFSAPDFHP